MNSNKMNTNLKTSFTNSFPRRFGRLLMVLGMLWINSNQIFANVMKIKVNYWADNFKSIDVTDQCKVWVVNKSTDEKVKLELNSGAFIFDGNAYRTVYFLIEDQLKREHIIHACVPDDQQTELRLEIGTGDYQFYPLGQPRPFYPILDKIYLTLDKSKVQKRYPNLSSEDAEIRISEDLRKIGLSKTIPYGYNIYKINETLDRSKVIDQLLELKVADIASSIYKCVDKPVFSVAFHLNEVDVLLNNSLSDKSVFSLLRIEGVTEVTKESTDNWSNYPTAKTFRLRFDQKAMLSYDFLKQLEKLMHNNDILAIRTRIGRPTILD
jgi:hypothetical protein